MQKAMIATLLILSGVATLPAVAAPSQVLRVGVEQAAIGYPVPVTFDLDQVIKFEGDRIVEVWASNVRLFKPRFTKGGNLIVLQAVATPEELKAVPELGRGLGTLTVELASGESAVFNLAYTPKPRSGILTVFRNARKPASGEVLPTALAEHISQSTQALKPSAFRVSQDGFVSPLIGLKPAGVLQPPGREQATGSEGQKSGSRDNDRTGYWLLEMGQADPGAWSSGPDSPAYRAFFEILGKGKASEASFEPTLSLAQRLSGVSDANLVWLARTLAARSVESRTVAKQLPSQSKTVTSAPEVESADLPQAKRQESAERPAGKLPPVTAPTLTAPEEAGGGPQSVLPLRPAELPTGNTATLQKLGVGLGPTGARTKWEWR